MVLRGLKQKQFDLNLLVQWVELDTKDIIE